MKTITVEIKDGKSTIETTGFEGRACLDATAELEKAMGVVENETKKPEFVAKHQQVQGH